MNRSKLYSVILSVLVSFGLWLFVVNNVSERDDITFYNIPVVMEGESVLNEQNLMITSVSTKTVSLNISGARSDLNQVNESNIIARVDLSNITEPGEKIPLSYEPFYLTGVSKNALTVESQSPSAIYVNVDNRRRLEIPVKVKWTGTRSEDYIYDTENYVLDNSMVTIVGPAAVADRIETAEIEVDLTDHVKSISESYRFTLCDKDGNGVDAGQITTNVEEIRLNMQIQKIKELKLEVATVYGGGATMDNTTIKVEPETIRVSGSEAVLAELGDSLTVATLNLADIEKSTNELRFPITLPEGVTNQTGVAEAEVSVRFAGLKTQEFVIENIQTVNVPQGMEAEIINANLTVKVRGPGAEMEKLTAEHIQAAVDFTDAEAGTATYKVAITISGDFPNVGALKTSAISATVRTKE